MKYGFENKPLDIKKVSSLSKVLNIPVFTAGLLITRGIDTTEKALFFFKEENIFFNPFLLKGMKESVSRIRKAKETGEKVFICGDYDVDGITSTAILLRAFSKLEIDVHHLLPTQVQGHGLSVSAVEEIKAQGGSLIVTVDNGITSYAAVKKANELNIDVIITDHHEITSEGLPEAFSIINPKQEDCQSPYKFLSGGGIALYLARGLSKEFEKESVVDKDLIVLASISTIADVAPLSGDNRTIVKTGLKSFFDSGILGLSLLLEKSGLSTNELSPRDVSFKIAPLINAAGKFGFGEEALQLLTEKNYFIVNGLINKISSINNSRKEMVSDVFPTLENQARIRSDLSDSVLIVSGSHNSAINGILASRLVEKFQKPCIVFSLNEEEKVYRGSCRSIDGFNMQQAIEELSGYHLGGGGHYMAAGVSIKQEDLDLFREKINEIAKNNENKIKNEKKWTIDGEMSFEQINIEFLNSLQLLQPFGAKNDTPFLKLNHIKIIKKQNGRYNSSYIRLKDQDVRVYNNSDIDLGDLPTGKEINAIVEINFQDGQPLFIIKDFELENEK